MTTEERDPIARHGLYGPVHRCHLDIYMLSDASMMVQPELHSLPCMQAFNMMRVVGLASLLVLQCTFCTVSAVSTLLCPIRLTSSCPVILLGLCILPEGILMKPSRVPLMSIRRSDTIKLYVRKTQ